MNLQFFGGRGSSSNKTDGLGKMVEITVDKDWIYKPHPNDKSNVYKNLVPYVGNTEARKVYDDVFGWGTEPESYGVENVKLSELNSIQAFVTERGLKMPSKDEKAPRVIELDGKKYLFNGNHRVNKNILDGKKNMRIEVVHMKRV